MKKFFSISIFCFALIFSNYSCRPDNPVVPPPEPPEPPDIPVTEMTIGYCSESNDFEGLGAGAVVLQGAIRIPVATANALVGNKITKIKFGVCAQGVSLSNAMVFISESLGGEPVVSQTVESITDGWNEVTLTTPYEIESNTEFYVGYSYKTSGGYPLAIDLTTFDPDNGGFIAIGTNWTTLTAEGFDCNLALYTTVEGDNLPQYDLDLTNLNLPNYYLTGSNIGLKGSVTNRAAKTITSFEVIYKIGNNDEKTYIVSNVNIPNYASYDFTVPNISTTQQGAVPVSVRIGQLNGNKVDVYQSNNSKNTVINSYPVLFLKKTVVEEGTGTWCGWCPRGIVGMRTMAATYPDKFIGIAVHNGDPMAVTAYNSGMGFSGFPNAAINRAFLVDPNATDLDKALSQADEYFIYGIEITNAQINGSTIDATVKITSAVDTVVNQNVAFVIVENDVTGTGSGYNQQNYYANNYAGPMGGFESLPSVIPASQMVYQEVARGIFPSFNGAAGSVPSNLTANVPVTFSYTINLPSTINNIANIELIALLLENKPGGYKPWQIVNATKIHF
ncbi:MAG: Omp28-related outer membrane protein [Paludibacter sp.]|nr:Omp28-related outer membrane protein [Paludibacter sp.]